METSPPWHQRYRLLLWLGALLLLQWGAWRILPGPAATWTMDDAKLLPIKPTQLQSITPDTGTGQLLAKEKAFIAWPAVLVVGLHPDNPTAGAQYIKMTILCERPIPADKWTLQYTTRELNYIENDFIQSRSIRPTVKVNGSVVELAWQLPCIAEFFRILVPPSTQFSIQHLQMSGCNPAQEQWHTWRQAIIVLCLSVNVGLLLGWLSQHLRLFRNVCTQPALLSTVLLLIHGSAMIWLLPPFQGPDENRHWKQAMRLYRSDGQPGSALYQLPMTLDAESPRWHSEIPFPTANLKAGTQVNPDKGEDKEVGYVKHWGYPLVGLVSLLFPTVQTTSEALIFYYVCRVVSLICLLLMVAYAWRMGLGSWTLVAFLTFPLVLQQCLIVSTDTTHNLGTFLAVLLFRRRQLVRSNSSWLMLLVICCLVVASKPPIYLTILILPAWFLPWKRILKPAVLIPTLLVLAGVVAAGLWYLWQIVDQEGMQLGEQARQQLRYVLSAEGLGQFIVAAMEYPTRFLNPACWWQPLGWLDTRLSDLHVNLLWISLIIALALDAVRWSTWLQLTPRASLWGLVEPLTGSLLHLFFVWWSLALVMYLTITDLKAAGIVGMQVRYMIPVALLVLLWPGAFLPPRASHPRSLVWLVLTLGTLAMVRVILMAGDLQFRYWG